MYLFKIVPSMTVTKLRGEVNRCKTVTACWDCNICGDLSKNNESHRVEREVATPSRKTYCCRKSISGEGLTQVRLRVAHEVATPTGTLTSSSPMLIIINHNVFTNHNAFKP